VTRGQAKKWQDIHLDLIEDVLMTRKLQMEKQATVNRLLSVKGWRGGNRAKNATPTGTTEDEWISCGDCGRVDSQNHWIRECSEGHIRSIRLDTKEQVRKQLDNIQLEKVKKDVWRENPHSL